MTMIRSRISKLMMTAAVLMLLIAAAAVPAHAADLNGAKQAIANAAKAKQLTVDLSSYGIPYQQYDDLYHEWHYKGVLPWYINGSYYTYYNNTIRTVNLEYWDPAAYSYSAYEQNLQRIVNECVHDGMSDWQIALSFYNYLAGNVAYSEVYPEVGGIQRNAYGAIVNRDAVCLGYAHAYMELLTRCGIPCVMVESEGMNHAWNLVMIRGNWYHVDATWGDPLVLDDKDAYGTVSHAYFLLSDTAIADSEHEHYGWDRFYSCPDTFFDTNTFWNELDNHVWYMDNTVSFLRRSTNKEINIIRRDELTGQETVLCSIEPAIVDIGYGRLYYPNHGISLWNDTIYFSDAANVYALSPAGGEPQVIVRYDCAANGKTIYGSFVRDGVIYLSLKTHNNTSEKIAYYLPATSHTHSFQITDHAPTCMAQGYTSFYCACGDSFNSGMRDTVDHKTGSSTVLAEPTWNNAGLTASNCIWCGKYLETTLPALYELQGTFSDVSSADYFNESVLWAYIRGVTSGTSNGVFSPYNTCTRAQVVTFLWRAMGSPEPAGSYEPFDDVTPDSWYYKPVLWALEQGITSGIGPTTFGSDAPCTRAQVVTFLWRTAGSPEPIAPNRFPFTDVDPYGYYIRPMVWAVEQSITSGTAPASFSPDAHCTRGQTVTFLRKYLVG